MKISVLFFARAREITEVGEVELELPSDATNLLVMQMLLERWPELQEVVTTCVLALNHEYISNGETHQLKEGDELAVIPPISGG